MEISRYASRLAPTSSVLPSGRPLPSAKAEVSAANGAEGPTLLPLKSSFELPQEPEDARLTGGTRSLSRRLLALNIPGLSAAHGPDLQVSREASSQKPRTRKTLLTRSGLMPQDA